MALSEKTQDLLVIALVVAFSGLLFSSALSGLIGGALGTNPSDTKAQNQFCNPLISCPKNQSCTDNTCQNVRCTDSDNGNNPQTKGTLIRSTPTATIEFREDFCIGSDLLTEYTCIGTESLIHTVFCEKNSCMNGECVPENG